MAVQLTIGDLNNKGLFNSKSQKFGNIVVKLIFSFKELVEVHFKEL